MVLTKINCKKHGIQNRIITDLPIFECEICYIEYTQEKISEKEKEMFLD